MPILDTILPVFLVIALGALLRRRGFLAEATRLAVSRLVFYVAAPALLLHSTARTPLAESLNLTVLATVIGVTFVAAFVLYLAAARTAPNRRGVIAQGGHRSNMVFLGVPVITYAYGEAAIGSVAVLIGIMVAVYNFVAVILLTLPHEDAPRSRKELWKRTAGKIARNPLILGCAGGLVCAAAAVPIPVFLERALQLVGQIAAPLALLAVGADLDFRHLRGDVTATALVALVKLVIYPGAIALVLLACGLEGTAVAASVLLMAAPVAVVSYIMAQELRGDHRLAGSLVIGTTTVSLFTYIGWLLVLQRI